MTPLLEQLADRPHDLELRRVVADALQAAGNPHGELIAVQCALATATGAERAALRAREADLLRSPLGDFDRGGMRARWRLGFVASVTVLERGAERLPALLADPAMRLVEELAIAAEPHELAAIGRAILARPQPSRLRSVVAGPPGPDRAWIARADAAWLAPLAAMLPGLATLPAAQVPTSAFEAQLASEDIEIPEWWLVVEQLAPALDYSAARLRARPGCGPSIARLHAGFPVAVQRLMTLDAASCVSVASRELHEPVSCRSVYRAVCELAPYVEDVRFALSWRIHVVEITIADGAVDVCFGTPTSPHIDATYDYWDGRLASRPDDIDLRDFVLWTTLSRAEEEIERLPRAMPDEHLRARGEARRLLDRAAALYVRLPRLWELRGRLARELGDLDEAARCFREVVALEDPLADFDLALVAFTRRDEAAARTHVARRLAATPDHSASHVLAGVLAETSAAAREHFDAVAAIAERRRIDMTPFAELDSEIWPRLEPDLVALVETARYGELAAACIAGLAGARSRIGAAAHLLAWADFSYRRYCAPPRLDLTPEQFVWHSTRSPERAAAERVQAQQKDEAGALADDLFAAAAAQDPLAGCVHQRWARHARERRGEGAARQLLERALEINPHHLESLDDLAAVHARAGDPTPPAALYERYVDVLRLLLPFDGERGGWCPFPTQHAGSAYLARTCAILYGVPAWDERAPGVTPDRAAIAEAAALLARVEPPLREVVASLEATLGKEPDGLVAVELANAIVATERGDHAEALALADRAIARDAGILGLMLRAHCQLALGHYEDARDAAEEAVRRSGRIQRWPAHFLLASAEAALGADSDPIVKSLDAVLWIAPGAVDLIRTVPELARVRELPAVQRLLADAPARTPTRITRNPRR